MVTEDNPSQLQITAAKYIALVCFLCDGVCQTKHDIQLLIASWHTVTEIMFVLAKMGVIISIGLCISKEMFVNFSHVRLVSLILMKKLIHMILLTIITEIVLAVDHFWTKNLYHQPVIIFGLRFGFFYAHFWEKTHIFKICALKKRNDFQQLKRSSFRVEKCKTDENLLTFLKNMAYKTVTSMRDCVMKRNYM